MGKRLNRKERKREHDTEEMVDDPRVPVIRFPLVILRYLGVDFFLILFGLFGAAISGAVPIVINLVLGNVIDGLTKSSAATKSKVVNAASAVRTLASFQTIVTRSGTSVM